MPTLKISIPYTRYIDEKKNLFEKRLYNQANYDKFIKEICSEPNLHQKLSTAIKALQVPGATKYIKREKYALADRLKTRLPCSVIKLLSPDEKNETSYYLMTPFCLGAPGGFGVVKVVVRITLEKGGYNLCFATPAALKIIYQQNINPQEWLAFCSKYSQYYGETAVQQERRVDEEIYKRLVLMPIMPGMELYNFFTDNNIKKYGELNLQERIEICLSIANTLNDHFHSKGTTHSDIKQENVYLSKSLFPGSQYTARFIDIDDGVPFGTAMQAETIPMTLEYAPPEYGLPRLHATSAAEIYSLGVLFSEMFDFLSNNAGRLEKYNDCSFAPETLHTLRRRCTIIATQFPIKFPSDMLFSPEVNNLLAPMEPNSFIFKQKIITPLVKLLKTMCNPEPEKRPALLAVIETLQQLARQAAALPMNRPSKYRDVTIVAQNFLSKPTF